MTRAVQITAHSNRLYRIKEAREHVVDTSGSEEDCDYGKKAMVARREKQLIKKIVTEVFVGVSQKTNP